MSKENYDHLKTITPVFRATWVNLFEKDKQGKYSLTMLFDPEDDLKKCPGQDNVKHKFKMSLKQIVMQAIKEKWGDKTPKNLKLPFHEQDEDYDGYADHGFYAAARSPKRKPYVVDTNQTPLTDEEFYSGCYAQAIVHAYPFDFEDKEKGVKSRGVSLTLHGVIKIKDGERLGGGGVSNPENDFEAMEGVDEMDDAPGDDDLDALING